jgi:hypothetical protein
VSRFEGGERREGCGRKEEGGRRKKVMTVITGKVWYLL